MKNIKKSIIASILMMVLLFSLILLGDSVLVQADTTTPEESCISQQYDEKLVSEVHTPNVDEDFSEDEVIVILKRKYNNFNLETNTSKSENILAQLCEFENIERKAIEDLFPLQDQEEPEITYRKMLSLGLKTPGKEKVIEAIEYLQNLDVVLVAQPKYIYGVSSDWVPSDADYFRQWGLRDPIYGINVEKAWDISRGSNVRVGIFEKGIDSTHEDLKGRFGGGNFTPASGTDLSHGTHVGGIISAVANTIGIAGISEATLFLLNRSDFVSSLQYAINNNIRIINASFYFARKVGGVEVPDSPDPAHIQAIVNYGNFGGILICSAGNDGNNTDDSPQYPAGYGNIKDFPRINNVISVGSIDSYHMRALDSNYGENSVHIYAPGVGIYSTLPGNTYGNMSGTSMAAPHVTGVAALLLSKNPALTIYELKDAILNNADNITISVPSSKVPQNVKKLNAYKALNSLCGTPSHYNFVIEEINFMASSATYLTDVTLNYWDSYQYTAEEYNTWTEYSFDGKNIIQQYTRGFTRWMMCLNGVDGYDLNANPWIEFSYDRTLSFNVAQIISNYYPYYQEFQKIHFRAVYKEVPSSGGGSCVAEGALITLANGEQVPVEQLTGDETLLVWNLFTGTFDTAPILCIDRDSLGTYEVINLYFSDNTQVKVISEHAFWDFDLNKYVYLDKNASEYIGHWFNKQTANENGEFSWTSVQLTDVIIQEEYTTAWSPVTYSHLCYYVNGMLSMPGGIEGLFNIFEVDSQTMTYNSEAMAEDIEQYGLFTYEEFAELLPVPNEVFEAVNGQYLKVAIGKGLIDLDTLASYINQYSRLFN